MPASHVVTAPGDVLSRSMEGGGWRRWLPISPSDHDWLPVPDIYSAVSDFDKWQRSLYVVWVLTDNGRQNWFCAIMSGVRFDDGFQPAFINEFME